MIFFWELRAYYINIQVAFLFSAIASIIEFITILEPMQNSGEKNKKFSLEIRELLNKIGRLRRKLLTYGYASDEVISIILHEFLKLPKVDWENLNTTTSYYDFKDHFRTDARTTELIMCMQKMVPNLHTPQVCQYLLRVLEFNSLAFGFNLLESSSDSNESNSVLHRRLLHRSKRRLKNSKKKEKQRRDPDEMKDFLGTNPIKKMHKMEISEQDIKNSGEEQQSDLIMNKYLQNKPKIIFNDLDFQFQKEIKRINTDENDLEQCDQEQGQEVQKNHEINKKTRRE